MAFKNKTIKTNPIKIGASSQQLLLIIGPPLAASRGGAGNKHVGVFFWGGGTILAGNKYVESGKFTLGVGNSGSEVGEYPGCWSRSWNVNCQCWECSGGARGRLLSPGIKPGLSQANPPGAAARPPCPRSRGFLLVISPGVSVIPGLRKQKLLSLRLFVFSPSSIAGPGRPLAAAPRGLLSY